MKITGARGDWTASVENKRLAVLHTHWWSPPHTYHDPMIGAVISGKRYSDLVAALEAHSMAVMQRDRKKSADTPLGFVLERDGYVGVFAFSGLAIAEDGAISLTITSRWADPR